MPKVYIKKGPVQKAANGASVSPIADGVVKFNGPSHADGGIPISYGGTPIEVEGDETAYQSPKDNSLTILGNMTVPGTKLKFKSFSQMLADKEQKVGKLMDKGASLVNSKDPQDPWDSLAFNSGKAMLQGGTLKKQELAQSKEHLANLQNTLLDLSEQMEADPQELSKGKIVKAKNGYQFPGRDQWRGTSITNVMNPSQLNKLDSPAAGISGTNLWMSPEFNTFKNFSQADLPVGGEMPTAPADDPYPLTQNTTRIPTNARPLALTQVMPELYGFASNKQVPVGMQSYNPQLYNSYQVSYQDQLNKNQTTFSSLQRQLGSNPEALATLYGQKYAQDNAVQGEEFRTNQQIQNDITNKNTSLLNEANQKNLALADQQFTRQSQAKSATKAQNAVILNSLSEKMLQNESRNQGLKYYESLTGFRFNPDTQQMEWMGGNNSNSFSTGAVAQGTALTPINPNGEVSQKFDGNGKLQETKTKTKGITSAQRLVNNR